jgi:hypothetical protein
MSSMFTGLAEERLHWTVHYDYVCVFLQPHPSCCVTGIFGPVRVSRCVYETTFLFDVVTKTQNAVVNCVLNKCVVLDHVCQYVQ